MLNEANVQRHREADQKVETALRTLCTVVFQLAPGANASLNLDAYKPHASFMIPVTHKGVEYMRNVRVEITALRDAKRSSMSYTYYNGVLAGVIYAFPHVQRRFRSKKDGLDFSSIAQDVIECAMLALSNEKVNQSKQAKLELVAAQRAQLAKRFPSVFFNSGDLFEIRIRRDTKEEMEKVLMALDKAGLL